MIGLFAALALLVAFLLGYLHGRWVWRDSPKDLLPDHDSYTENARRKTELRRAIQSQQPPKSAPATMPGSFKRDYTCPVCGTTNRWAYLNCNRPNCTDGRDPR